MPGKGTSTVNFGTVPGSNTASVVVTGVTGITPTSHAEAFLMRESSADHNADEHGIVPFRITCGDIVAGTGFTIYVASEWRLTGTFTIRWVWA